MAAPYASAGCCPWCIVLVFNDPHPFRTPLRPDWLFVPAAIEPVAPLFADPGLDAPAAVGASASGMARTCEGTGSALAASCPRDVRVVAFRSDDPADLNRRLSLALATRAPWSFEPRRRLDCDVDLLNLTLPAHLHAVRKLPDGCVPLIAAESRRRRVEMDKHGLDVALSIGRHAAERARLAGKRFVVGVGISSSSADASDKAGRHGRLIDPYEALLILGSAELAVLVGLVVASAQMGLRAILVGQDAPLVTVLAIRLHPGVENWLVREEPQSRYQSSQLRLEAV